MTTPDNLDNEAALLNNEDLEPETDIEVADKPRFTFVQITSLGRGQTKAHIGVLDNETGKVSVFLRQHPGDTLTDVIGYMNKGDLDWVWTDPENVTYTTPTTPNQ